LSPFNKLSRSDENKRCEPGTEPDMNIKGVRWCIDLMRPYMRKNNIITELDREAYKGVMLEVYDLVYLGVGERAVDFEIKNDSTFAKVCNQICHSILLILIGASGSKNYKQWLQESNQRTEHVQVNNDQNQQPMQVKKPTFMDSIKNTFR